MGDSPYNSGSSGNSEVKSLAVRKKVYNKNNLCASYDPKPFPQNVYKHITSLSLSRNGSSAFVHVALFLLKLAALETLRRVSKSKFPPLWRGVQAVQFLCYPPFKWIQKWAPFKGLVKGVESFSRPLLFLSIATAFSEQSECDNGASNEATGSQAHSDSETDRESSPSNSTPDTSDVNPEDTITENWLIRLHKELENQGITLPERISEEELHRFHAAASGDFSCLLSSVKKTILWRENYRILSEEELLMWSNLVFWHGFDVESRPCLIVRLGLACLNLPSHERPRFAQAVVSQVEHGVLRLVDRNNPQITVLVDCDGISPLRLPMQMLRCCSSLLQDNFPNRLGHLLVIRLPPVVRVIAQTFIQVLKPVTRKKLRIEGNMYHRVICEYLETIPSYLGGNCMCKICASITIHDIRSTQSVNEICRVESIDRISDTEEMHLPHPDFENGMTMSDSWDKLLRTVVIGVLIVWVLMALIALLNDSESGTL